MQHAADVIALVSADLEIEYVSPGIESMVGRSAAQCSGRHIRDVLGRDAAADIAQAHETLTLSDYVSCEWRLTNELRGQRQVYARLTLRHDGSLVLNLRDVTEQRALEAQLQHRANVDELTGLPNRAALTEQLGQRERVDVTVLFIDLDGFKEVNDSLGHEQGDRVLRDVGSRIASVVRSGVTVGRLGGDEFLAIMQGTDINAAQVVAKRIIDGIVQVGSILTMFPLSASVGIATGGPRRVGRADPAPRRQRDVHRQGPRAPATFASPSSKSRSRRASGRHRFRDRTRSAVRPVGRYPGAERPSRASAVGGLGLGCKDEL